MFCFYRWLLFCLCILYLPTSSLYVQYLIYDMGDRVHLIAQPWNWNSKLNGLITFTLYYKKPVKMCKQRSVTQFLQLQSLESNSCRNKPFFKTAKNTIGSSYRIPCGFGFQTWFEPLGPRVYSLLLPYDPLTIACLHKLYWVWKRLTMFDWPPHCRDQGFWVDLYFSLTSSHGRKLLSFWSQDFCISWL